MNHYDQFRTGSQAGTAASSLAPVSGSTPDSATSVCSVVGTAGNQMYVQVKYRVPCGRPVVDAKL
jgi:hypothetical protein